MSHYQVSAIRNTIDDLREMFPEGKADSMNWVIGSTSGVHGSYTSLDEILAGRNLTEDDDDYCGNLFTVLVIQPRRVRLLYGNVTITNDGDMAFLRGLIASSLEEIQKSQEGNT
jgi:hypothetical protein